MSSKYEILPARQRFYGRYHQITGFPWLPISSKLCCAMAASGRPGLCNKVGFWHLQPGTKLCKWLSESVWLFGPHGQIPYGRVREWWIVFVAEAPSGGWISYWNINIGVKFQHNWVSLSLSNRKCGYYSPSDPLTFISSRNVMLVTLVTNDIGNYPGFRATVSQIKRDGKDQSWLAEQKHTWLINSRGCITVIYFVYPSLYLPFQ